LTAQDEEALRFNEREGEDADRFAKMLGVWRGVGFIMTSKRANKHSIELIYAKWRMPL
jgi:hypothetical protein